MDRAGFKNHKMQEGCLKKNVLLLYSEIVAKMGAGSASQSFKNIHPASLYGKNKFGKLWVK